MYKIIFILMVVVLFSGCGSNRDAADVLINTIHERDALKIELKECNNLTNPEPKIIETEKIVEKIVYKNISIVNQTVCDVCDNSTEERDIRDIQTIKRLDKQLFKCMNQTNETLVDDLNDCQFELNETIEELEELEDEC